MGFVWRETALKHCAQRRLTFIRLFRQFSLGTELENCCLYLNEGIGLAEFAFPFVCLILKNAFEKRMHLSWTDGKSQHNANRSILRGMQKSQEQFIFRDIFYIKLIFQAFFHLAPRADIVLTLRDFRQIVGNFLFSTFFTFST